MAQNTNEAQNTNKVGISQFLLITVCGCVITANILLLLTVAGPSYDNYLLPTRQYQDLLKLAALTKTIYDYGLLIESIGFFSYIVLSWIFLSLVNPAYKIKNLKFTQRRFRAISLVLVALILLAIAIFNAQSFAKNTYHNAAAINYIVFIMVFGLVWLVTSPAGYARFGANDRAPNLTEIIRSLVFGAAFGLFTALVMFMFTFLLEKYFALTLNALGQTHELSWYGWKLVSAGVLFFVLIMLYSLYGCIPLFQASAVHWKQRARAGILGVGVVAFVAIGLAGLQPVLNSKYQMNVRSLVQAAGLEKIKPKSITFVRFCADGSCYSKDRRSKKPVCNGIETRKMPKQIDSYEMLLRSSPYPLSLDAIPKLEKLVLSKKMTSIYRKSAINAVSDIYMRLLRPEEYFSKQQEFASKGVFPNGPGLLAVQYHLHWLANSAPINDENRLALQAYMDTRHYHHGKEGIKKLVRALVRFGLTGEAQKLYAHYKETDTQSTKKERPLLLLPEMTNGSISGSVKISNVDPKSIRVVVFKVKHSTKSQKPPVQPDNYFLSIVVANTTVDKAGRFSVKHLTEGLYGIALMVTSEQMIAGKVINGRNVTGLIKLDRLNSQVMLKPIELSVSQLTCKPRGSAKVAARRLK